jgi:serine/threonine protein kinase/Tol biopolymer transport system component
MMADLEQSAEQLFGEALELQPEQRAAFLDQACRDAPELRSLVEALLRDNQRVGSFLAAPLFGLEPVPPTAIPPLPGRFQTAQLIASRFLVVRFIARGGMGEVYEAKDQFLQGASIALKIIRPEIAADAASSSRFEQEVILARKVVHPNLCPIYEIFHCEQPAPPFLFLTMRLLQGETLDARLKAETKLGNSEVLEICSQLLSGVAALHAAGIIHRDLKPNNVMLEREGQRLNVSIMDFGLARLHQAESSVLGTGMIAGTPGYMAPELLRGQRPTKATDIYALGIVLHQVLTGERPLESETGLSVTPAPSLRSVHGPAQLVEAVESFLSLDPERRYRAFEQVRPAQQSATSVATFSRSSPLHRKATWYWAAGVFAAVALGIAMFMTAAPVSGPLDSTQITFSSEPKEGPLFTDGSRLYFESRGVPSEMAVSGGMIAPMPQVEPGMRLMDISTDGAKVLEWKPEVGDDIRRGSLWMASSLGGAPRRLGNYLVNTPEWGAAAFSPDGQSIVFTDRRMLYAADADGGNVKKIWEAPLSVDGVSFSPDGRELTVALWTSTNPSRLWKLKANGEDPHPLVPDWPADSEQWGAQWTPDGRHFIFSSDSEGPPNVYPNVYELVAPRWFEFWKRPSAVRITGNQIPILASAPARDSTHLFVLGRAEQGAMQALDPRTGRLEPFLGGLAASEFVISPDRQWMAYTEFPTGHLWKSRIDGSQPMQLTNAFAYMGQWSPDGKSLMYSDGDKLFLISAEGGPAEKLIESGTHEVKPTWSPDGKSIAFSYYNFIDQPLDGIFTVDLASRKLSMMPNTQGFQMPSWSPDGKYLVVIAQQPSRMMLYSANTRTWRVLTQFQDPWGFWTWSSDGKAPYMGMVQGHQGIYRLTIPDAKWEKVSELGSTYTGLYSGVAGGDAFVSLTADGQPAMMSHTGVAQIYSLRWKH